jgi:pimeloyl-ACP methyl ester carboxylesterase
MDRRPLLHAVIGEGEPIVLMPGTITGWVDWLPYAERFAERHMVVCPQLRSIELIEAGQPIPETYGVDTEREALLATADTLGLDQFDLVGWSSGGHIALMFALAYPERVRTLTLIEPSAVWLLRETGRAHDRREAKRVADIIGAITDKDITVDDLKAFVVRVGLAEPGTDIESAPDWPLMVQNRQSLALIEKEWDHTHTLEHLHALDVPILVVKGTDTVDFMAAIANGIVANAPNATLLELPGGHTCHLENLDRFLEALDRHLT